MLLRILLYNIYFNVFIFFINTSTSDALFKQFHINPSIISILRLLINFSSIVLILYYALTKRIKLKKYQMIIIFVFIIGASIIITPEKFEAIKMYINYIGLISYSIILFNNIEKERVVRYFKNYANLIVILDILTIFVFKNIGYMDKTDVIRGIHLSRSTLIIYLNLCIFIYVYYLYIFKKINNRIKKSILVMIFLSVLLIVLSGSSTGILTVALFIPLIIFLKSRQRILSTITVVVFIGVVLPLMNMNSSLLNSIVEGIFGKSLTFSGRKYIWSYVLSNLTSNPIFGNGFNSIEVLLKNKVIPIYERIATHSHNGFLQVFLENGLIGLVIIISIIFVFLSNLKKYSDFERRLLSSYIIVFIIFNFMEPYLLQYASGCTFWVIGIFIIVYNKNTEENISEG